MKERPISCTTEMIMAKLKGLKTMTRRLRGLDEINKSPDDWKIIKTYCNNTNYLVVFDNKKTGEVKIIKCPYGKVGDRLWVKETYMEGSLFFKPPKIIYKADNDSERWGKLYKWKPSMFMPRWTSRMTDEIVNIRVERLQEITPADVIAEGVIEVEGDGLALRDKFQNLWDSINIKRGFGWDTNPYVWVVEFKKV